MQEDDDAPFRVKSMPWLTAAGICVALTLNLWRHRTGGGRANTLDLVGSLLIVAVTVAFGWFGGRYLTEDRDRRGLVALLTGLWGLTFNTAQIAGATRIPALNNSLLAGIAWTVLCALIVRVVSLGRDPMTFFPRILMFGMAFLLVTESFRTVGTYSKAEVVDAPVDRRDGKTPDVFVVVLDKYTSGAWMSHSYKVNLDPFEDSLRALGFVVPSAARANYGHTHFALASFLNWQYLDGLDAESFTSWNQAHRLIENARAWTVFRKERYRVIAFPTNFAATARFPNVDRELRWPGISAAPFARTWLLNSPLAPLAVTRCRTPSCPQMGPMPYQAETLQEMEWKLATFASLPDSAGPVFAFLHLLLPHEPYLFNADCSPREPWWPVDDQGKNFQLVEDAYGSQVRCLNRLLLGTVRSLLKRSRVPPVIILQSDHGNGRIFINHLRAISLTASPSTRDRLGEHLGIFAAYFFPGADTAIYGDISPVNVMPLVLNSLFDERATLLPDRSYWSSAQDPSNFTEFPAEATRPPRQAIDADAAVIRH